MTINTELINSGDGIKHPKQGNSFETTTVSQAVYVKIKKSKKKK